MASDEQRAGEGDMVRVTGEDGTVYRVDRICTCGDNEHGRLVDIDGNKYGIYGLDGLEVVR